MSLITIAASSSLPKSRGTFTPGQQPPAPCERWSSQRAPTPCRWGVTVTITSHTPIHQMSPAHTHSPHLQQRPRLTLERDGDVRSRNHSSQTHMPAVPSNQRAPHGALRPAFTTARFFFLNAPVFPSASRLLSRSLKAEPSRMHTHCPAPLLTTHFPWWPGPHPRACPSWALTSESLNPWRPCCHATTAACGGMSSNTPSSSDFLSPAFQVPPLSQADVTSRS